MDNRFAGLQCKTQFITQLYNISGDVNWWVKVTHLQR